MSTQRYDLSFLDELGLATHRDITASERDTLGRVRDALMSADAVVIHFGGKSGRLGEAIIGTAFLEGTLQTLVAVGKTHTPLTAIIDSTIAELIPVEEYRARYWPAVEVIVAAPADVEQVGEASYTDAPVRNVLALDFHGEHDGMPSLSIEESPAGGQLTTLARLNRVALRSYAQRGLAQRYGAFFRDLFLLPENSLSGNEAQPRIYIPSAEDARYPQLVRAFGLDTDAILIVCFFQSVVAAKCYERWEEVMAMISAHVVSRFPGRRVNYLVACGPDTAQPVHQEDLAAILGGFSGSANNSRVIVATTPSLLDLAILLRHATLALSNDTGPGHLAGALGIPTITPFLPGTVYSRQIWASTRWHRGVTIEPNPYSFEALTAEIFAGRTDIINTISPERLAAEAIACL